MTIARTRSLARLTAHSVGMVRTSAQLVLGVTSMTDETDTPQGGLDDWWRAAANSADAADKEKEAVGAPDFQQARAYRYLALGGTDDIRRL